MSNIKAYDVFRKAQQLAHPDSRQQMIALLKTAELYTARGLQQKTPEAAEIFKKCLEKWPGNTMVLHKVAKFYQYSRADYEQAGKYYEKALESCPQNFPCLADYLVLYGRFLKRYEQIVKLIDRFVSHIRNSEHIVHLLIVKGQAYWIQKGFKEQACKAWIEIFKNFPQLAFKLERALAAGTSRTFGNVEISRTEVCPVFTHVVSQAKLTSNKTVFKFLKFLHGSADAINY